MADRPDVLPALRASVDRLAALVRPLSDDEIAQQAYPSEWTIADVLSHLGSSAVIFGSGLADGLAGTTTPDDFNQRVWDEWNAKSPRAKVDDALAADAELIAAFEGLTEEDRARFKGSMGPLQLDFPTFVSFRMNEHLLHEWDVAVTLDPTDQLAADGTAIVIDAVSMIGQWAAKPKGQPRTITVRTVDPERTFSIAVEEDRVGWTTGEPVADPDVLLPAESFIRLVYGRLDPDHTPDTVTGDASALAQLREVFPGL